MSQTNYKQKYLELRMKFMNAVDTAFRTGYEQGMQDAQVQQAEEAQMQAQEMQQAAMAGQGQPGQDPAAGGAPGEDPNAAPQQAGPMSENPQGSELDQHIQKLESMLGKSEDIKAEDIRKIIGDLKFAVEMKKSSETIPAIAKALHKPAFKLSKQASHNLNDSAKKGVTMQQKIVTDIMKSWEEEEKKAGKGVLGILGIEGLTKGE